MGDAIHIAGLELQARIGVTEEERLSPQRLTAYITLHPGGSFADLDEQLENTIDYAHVCKAIHALVAERPRQLLETLAVEMAAGIRARFPGCGKVDIELRKYALSDTAYVAARHSS